MTDLFRETAFGQLLNIVSNGKILPYPEQRKDFKLPENYLAHCKATEDSADSCTDSEKIILVDWYDDNDPSNPQNWSRAKKWVVTFVLCCLTFGAYCGASIITSGQGDYMQEFGLSSEVATLGLTMYIAAYGLGALIFSPLSEVPALGRNIFYWAPMVLFTAFTAGAATVHSYAGLVILRFLMGFMGAPILATGGASYGDIFNIFELPVMFSVWVVPAFSAPAIGPVIGNFAVNANGWRWTMWELLWIAGFVTVLLIFVMPETSHGTILLRRAKRLRKLTGMQNLKSQSEIDQSHMSSKNIVVEALVRPFQITVLDPSIAFTNFYTGIIYGVYYLFFESFPFVYGTGGTYNFPFPLQGLPYLTFVVGGIMGAAAYVAYQKIIMYPFYEKHGLPVQEKRLEPALISAILNPIGLFLYAWTARASVHWIVNLIGVTILVFSNFVTFQCIVLYVAMSYPQYAASILASNDTIRSFFAFGLVHAGTPMFRAMGIGGGTSFLAGISLLCVVGVWVLYLYGARLRAKSRFAMGDETLASGEQTPKNNVMEAEEKVAPEVTV